MNKKSHTIGLAKISHVCGCIKSSNNYKLLKEFEKYLNKKTSIEYMVKKFHDIDKMKYSVFSKEEIKLYKSIEYPCISIDESANTSDRFRVFSYLDEAVKDRYKYDIECILAAMKKQAMTNNEINILNLI